MKLKSISLLLLLPALMVLVACGEASELTPDIEATVEAKVKAVLTAVPTATPTQVPPTATPRVAEKEVVTATPTPHNLIAYAHGAGEESVIEWADNDSKKWGILRKLAKVEWEPTLADTPGSTLAERERGHIGGMEHDRRSMGQA